MSRHLARSLEDQCGCIVSTIDAYEELFRELDPLRSFGGDSISIYNKVVQQRGWSGAFWLFLVALGKLVIFARHGRAVRILSELLRSQKPAAVVSVIPLLNRAFAEAAQAMSPSIPLITVVIDFKECARGVWLQHPAQHIACFCNEVRIQALAFGISARHIHVVAGLELNRDDDPTDETAREVDSIGIRRIYRKDTKVALVVFGASGSRRMIKYASILNRIPDLYTIYVCGRADEIRAAISRQIEEGKGQTLGFVEDMASLYQASDVLISKPGPMTIWEAIQFRLPLVLEHNKSTLIQERFHAEWATSRHLAVPFTRAGNLESALRRVLATTWRQDYLVAHDVISSQVHPQLASVIRDIADAGPCRAEPGTGEASGT